MDGIALTHFDDGASKVTTSTAKQLQDDQLQQ
jgi:hypothetical protein